jgi:hypothetical protein
MDAEHACKAAHRTERECVYALDRALTRRWRRYRVYAHFDPLISLAWLPAPNPWGVAGA